MKVIADQIIAIAKEAGREILRIYHETDFGDHIDYKSDDSPLTLADKASHEIIQKALEENFPDIPILSEEGRDMLFEERKSWKTFWLVDPLDGTKEFIKRNGEFTVNIALIHDGYPVFGLVYAPELHTIYIGDTQSGKAYKIGQDGKRIELKVNNRRIDRVAVRSRSHASEEEETLLNSYGVGDSIAVGSALKFCMVAEGKADIYYRHGPTMEWDTGAGQAVIEQAGGRLLRVPDDKRFYYNKEDLRNGSFLVLGFEE